ncbi:HAD hydrolase-like protein, partial [Citrobacter freundii]|uniref:HAD hydrolase-like protein n=1 Tax=Citrobacter freundii TaxID=546 RepID=UPI001B7F8FA9
MERLRCQSAAPYCGRRVFCMIQALLFDLDGTLLDSRDAVIDAVAYTAEEYAPGHFSREELL